ncbi:hypothetical protein [Prosthecobacter vanneervenii]|uniref:Uncharacterized protein n=1 Tax=Prosthecobacter vanneervenii TaxID=48466 RepID=A0A7W7Y923_9BACT|nr:hypothetical protein [Prosthecobacter vanneervenii]MBB5031764.1 hypothetical protein [Prosthecobacter vanneervenii]
MWTPAKIETRKVKLDLSASGQLGCKVRQVLCDDVIICNATDHIEWTDHSLLEVELCEVCLFKGCSMGGCVALRRAADRVLFIPAFEAMLKGDEVVREYAPPGWMMKHGPLSLSQADWGVIELASSGAPSYGSLTQISTSEMLRLFHFLAPRDFLRDYLSPAFARWDLILATSGRDSVADIAYLKRLFSEPAVFTGHSFCTPDPGSSTVSVFLDFLSIHEWRVFSAEDKPAVRLSEDLYFRPWP